MAPPAGSPWRFVLMRAFAIFLVLIFVALASIGLLTYPAWLLLHPHFDFPFHRIGERIAMLIGLVGFVILAPRMRLGDRASLGYGVARARFLRELGVGLLGGVATMLAIMAVMAALGLRDWHKLDGLDGAAIAKTIGGALGSGLVVALIEETALRGIIFTGIQRESGTTVAVVLTSLVYSATHFFAKHHIDAAQVTPSSGWDLLAGTLHTFADPLAMVDAFLTYAAVGVILGAIRANTGHIASCMGLHAGWVWVILSVTGLSDPVRDRPLSFLLSETDPVGWLVFFWTLVIGVPLVRYYSHRSHLTPPQGPPPRPSAVSAG
jgi:CAAX protease family protein